MAVKKFLDMLTEQKIIVFAAIGILVALLGYFYPPVRLGAVGTGAFFVVLAVLFSVKKTRK